MNEEKKFRLNLELTPAAKERLDKVQKATESPSIVETIRRALALYELILQRRAQGSKLIFREPTGAEREIELL